MTETRVKLNLILENRLPEFIRNEFPLVSEFLSQYYLSLESQSGPYDIIQNIDKYIKIDNLTNLIDYVDLTQDVDEFDKIIYVSSTEGFPSKYGLLKINDEIITYTGITTNSFTGCIRGFSGVTSYEDPLNADQLIFSSSNRSFHENESQVENLSVLFLKQFFTKVKTQITPGFEDQQFVENLNQSLFIKQSSDFYKSKGTEESFKILFGALYGNPVEVIRPRDYLIQPSDAQYKIFNTIVVEAIEGDPEELLNNTLIQEETLFFPPAKGTVAKVEKIIRNSKNYYAISFDYDYNRDINVKGTIQGNFSIHPQTTIVSYTEDNSDFLDVDSTIGFPDSGELIVELDNGGKLTINYQSKSINQFFGCSGIIDPIPDGSVAKLNSYAYGYNGNNLIKVRISGVIEKINTPIDAILQNKNNNISIKTFGEDSLNLLSNNWFFNIATNYDIKNIIQESSTTYSVEFYDNHSFVIGDLCTISNVECQVISINNKKQITIQSNYSINTNQSNNVKRKISKGNFVYYPHLNNQSTNVDNVYLDFDNSIYVSAPSLPTYSNQRIFARDGSIVIDNLSSIIENIGIDFGRDHFFYTGDIIVYKSNNENSSIKTGIYYIERVDTTTVKISRSKDDLFSKKYVTISGDIIGDVVSFFDYSELNFSIKNLKSQKLVRKISNPIKGSELYSTKSGFTGIFVNGVELLNYKSKDKIFYGPIENIVLTASGEGYDIINPPVVNITDSVGFGASAYCTIVGNLHKIDIVDPGFDYIETPTITITGGNGIEASANANLGEFIHSISFNSENSNVVNINNNTIGFATYHKFKNFEEVVYETKGQSGIVGLVTNSRYIVSNVGLSTIRLYKSISDALSGINTIQLSSLGVGLHSFKSTKKRKKIKSITINNPGKNYSYKKRTVLPVGINTSLDIITIDNHDYKNGEIVTYTATEIPISGLTSGTSYYITKLNDNQFKLSKIALENESDTKDFFYQTKQYINFTNTGAGKHIFNYPTIELKINGKLETGYNEGQNLNAILKPIFRGSIKSVFLDSKGRNYGSSEIINYNRQPNIELLNGSGAEIIPIISSDGKIVDIVIQNKGINYYSQPDLVIYGEGSGAVLTPITSENGEIIEVKIISEGSGYSQNTTSIQVVPAGSGSKFESNIKSWNINLLNRLIDSNRITEDEGFIYPGINPNFGLEYCHLYAPKKLRESVFCFDGNNLIADSENDTSEVTLYHSPILGWSYDGHPIYGPYGYSSSSGISIVKSMQSGYLQKNSIKLEEENRPSSYPIGFFVEDYEFVSNGDLDENNGRFCITPEYPNGVYAYFCTLDEYKLPQFPYVIGNNYNSSPIEFNFSISSNQNEINFNEKNWLRNTSPYNLLNNKSGYNYLLNFSANKNTSYVSSVLSGSISSIRILNSGKNYKVNENVIFDNELSNGRAASAHISEISGKEIVQISFGSTTFKNVDFVPYNSLISFSTVPHNLKNNDVITVSGEKLFNKVTKIKVPQNKLSLSSGIGSTSVTGIITYLNVSGSLDYPNIVENDIYEISGEKLKILEIDKKNSKIKVLRNVENTSGIKTHAIGNDLTENPRKIIVEDLGIEKNSYNYKAKREYYFDTNRVVGLGTTYGPGITSTRFLDIENFRSKVTIGAGTSTLLFFEQKVEKERYSLNNFINIVDATNSNFNTSKSKVIGIGETYIKVDFDTSAFSVGSGVTAYVNKWKIVRVPSRSIYLPDHNLTDDDLIVYNPPEEGDPIVVIDPKFPDQEFPLTNDVEIYPVIIDKDTIGITTRPVGLTTQFLPIDKNDNILLIVKPGSNNPSKGIIHSFQTKPRNNLVTEVTNNYVTVVTSSNHGLSLGDNVNINLKSKLTKTVVVRYNDYNRRLIINPKTIESIDIANNTIKITNHGYETGEKVIYTSNTPIGGLQSEKIYFIIKVNNENIKLSESLYDVTKNDPDFINLSSSGSGTLASINPPLKFISGEKVVFDLSDDSLSYTSNFQKSAFEFALYLDSNFKTKFEFSGLSNIPEVSRTGRIGIDNNASLSLQINENVPKKLYYKLIPINSSDNSPIKKEIIIDSEQNSNNSLIIGNSVYSGNHVISGLTSNTFRYNLNNILPEENIYYNPNTAEISYTTTSNTALGGISKINISNKGIEYLKLPKIDYIETLFGKDALLTVVSEDIGIINHVEIEDIGYNYSSDFTIRPKAKIPQILKVETSSIFDYIGISTVGINYITAPNLIVFDGLTNKIVTDVELEYNLQNNYVSIIQNTKGISEVTPKIIPINNSNGIGINSISYDENTKDVTLSVKGTFLNKNLFPFNVGDQFLIENTVSNFGKGYNSEDYNYSFFTINQISINNVGVTTNPTITYSLEEYLLEDETPGIFDDSFISGFIVPEKYLIKFNPVLKKNNFSVGETVKTKNSSGSVQNWDNVNYLSVLSNDVFEIDDIIFGQTSNTRGTIKEVYSFDSTFYNISSSSIVKKGWQNEVGFLNNNIQRIHDNDYYQYFSYSLKSNVQLQEWDEIVDKLNHTSGFKKFSDLVIESYSQPIGITSSFESSADSFIEMESFASIDCMADIDLVSEGYINFTSGYRSSEVYTENLLLSDYLGMKGNKVLILDDISSDFDGENSSFELKTNNTPVFLRDFVGTAISITDNYISLENHFFVTGEKVRYISPNDGQPIGIADTFIGIGITNILPSTIYIIKESDSKVKVAASASEALKLIPIPLEINNIGVGTHRFISEKQNTKLLLSIDNIIQSPISNTTTSTVIVDDVGIETSFVPIYGNPPIFSNDYIKINSEIMKVISVSGNNVEVIRNVLGTGVTDHIAGDQVIKILGNYNVVDNTIYFSDPPYGNIPQETENSEELDFSGITTNSTFFGRVFLRSGITNSAEETYSKNAIFDNVSNEFNGIEKTFILTSDFENVTGISTGNSILMINNVFQTPNGLNFIGDYSLDEISGITSASFTGSVSPISYDINNTNVPRGGVIISVASTGGFGYQPLVSAGGTSLLSISGSIQNISIANSGSGYRSGIQTVNVGIKTDETGTTNIGIATVLNGHIIGVSITNPGIGYTLPPEVIFDPPLPYSNIPLIYSSSGIGTQSTVDIIVGQDSKVLSFEIKNFGYGYSSGDVLTVGIGGTIGIPTSTSFDEFKIIVDRTYSDTFSSWYMGDLLILDPLDKFFNNTRKNFYTRINNDPVTITSAKGKNIKAEPALLVFINDVLQLPGISYTYDGSFIKFTDAPRVGDKSRIVLYTGTYDVDIENVNVIQSIKSGDDITLLGNNLNYIQNKRTVTNIKSADIVETNVYSGPGISTDENILRPINWCRQRDDKIISEQKISKSREIYEPSIYPISNIISNVTGVSTQIFVESVKTFFDNFSEGPRYEVVIQSQNEKISAAASCSIINSSVNEITITNPGFGYTESPEILVENSSTSNPCVLSATIGIGGTIESISIVYPGSGYEFIPSVLISAPKFDQELITEVKYDGDFGIITGVQTTFYDGSNALVFDFYIPENSYLKNSLVTNPIKTESSISNEYYFVISNSNTGNSISSGIITSKTTSNDIIGISSYLDNVYQVSNVSIGQTYVPGETGLKDVVKVTTKADYSGITGFGYSTFYGEFSWGMLYDFNKQLKNSYNAYNLNGYSGISTSAIVYRYRPLKYQNYSA